MLVVSVPGATFGNCNEYEDWNGKVVGGKSVVITPLRITILSEETHKISFGCNLWKSCKNRNCSYCQAGMDSQ